MARFWQKRQPRVQPPKKTAPLPPLPASTGSSHLWSMVFATRAVSGQRQKPSFQLPFSRSALADYISADRSAMMRELKKMREEGLVSTDGREITFPS